MFFLLDPALEFNPLDDFRQAECAQAQLAIMFGDCFDA